MTLTNAPGGSDRGRSLLSLRMELERGDRYRVTMLVGDGTYNGIYFPKEEVIKAAASMRGRPLNLDHSEKIEDIVGVVAEAWAEAGALRGVIILDPARPKYALAKAHVDGLIASGATPNVSVEVYRRLVMEQINGADRLTARDLDFAALALVSVGACDDKSGCGVAATYSKEAMEMTETTIETPAAAPAPEAEKVKDNLCAAKCAAMKAEKEALAAEVASATKARADLESQLAAMTAERDSLRSEKERAPVVSEIAKLSPTFKTDGLSLETLSSVLAALKTAEVPAVRRTALSAAPAEEKGEDPRAKLRKAMGIPDNVNRLY